MSDFLLQFKNEKKKLKKLLKVLEEFDTLENKEQLDFLIIKLQDINFDLNQAINQMYIEYTQDDRDSVVSNELDRRDRVTELLPLFMNIYANSMNS